VFLTQSTDLQGKWRRPGGSVYAAYLARIDSGGQTSVALCLKTPFVPDRGLAEKIGSTFQTIFEVNVHLDIMFPNAAEEAELSSVCRSLFGGPSTRSDGTEQAGEMEPHE
jgi:hypothetical protein